MRAILLLALAGCWRATEYKLPLPPEGARALIEAKPERLAIFAARTDGAGWVDARKLQFSTTGPRVRARALDPRRVVGLALFGAATLFASLGSAAIAIDATGPSDFPILSLGIGVPLVLAAVLHTIAGAILFATGVEHPAEVAHDLDGWTYYR